MTTNRAPDRRCSYVVRVGNAATSFDELRDLAAYLSALGVAGCDVVILDPSPRLQFDINGRVLRWVGRHVAMWSRVDLVQAASMIADCEKVIVAADEVRYTPEAIAQLCDLLDAHEVVEPQDYLDPMPWWGGIEAGRILVHRGIEPQPDHGATFGFRRSALSSLRTLGSASSADMHSRLLAAMGAEVYSANDVFVRRQPGALGEWLESRARLAGDDFALPMKTAFFFSLVPLLVLLATLGGLKLAGGYASMIAFASVALALRGRSGAATFFPLRACLLAPVWVFERSMSVYWALFRKLRGVDVDVSHVHVPDPASGTNVGRASARR